MMATMPDIALVIGIPVLSVATSQSPPVADDVNFATIFRAAGQIAQAPPSPAPDPRFAEAEGDADVAASAPVRPDPGSIEAGQTMPVDDRAVIVRRIALLHPAGQAAAVPSPPHMVPAAVAPNGADNAASAPDTKRKSLATMADPKPDVTLDALTMLLTTDGLSTAAPATRPATEPAAAPSRVSAPPQEQSIAATGLTAFAGDTVKNIAKNANNTIVNPPIDRADGVPPAAPEQRQVPFVDAPRSPVDVRAMASFTPMVEDAARDLINLARDADVRFNVRPETLGKVAVVVERSEAGTVLRLGVETQAAVQAVRHAEPMLTATGGTTPFVQVTVDMSGAGDRGRSSRPLPSSPVRRTINPDTATTVPAAVAGRFA